MDFLYNITIGLWEVWGSITVTIVGGWVIKNVRDHGQRLSAIEDAIDGPSDGLWVRMERVEGNLDKQINVSAVAHGGDNYNTLQSGDGAVSKQAGQLIEGDKTKGSE